MSPATLFLEGVGLVVTGLLIRWWSTRTTAPLVRPSRAASRRPVASVLVGHYGLDTEEPDRPQWPSPVVMAGVALSSVAVLAMTTGSSIRSPGSKPFDGRALEELRGELAALAEGLRNRITIASQRLERIRAVAPNGRSDRRVVPPTTAAATTRLVAPASARVTAGGGQGMARAPDDPPKIHHSQLAIVSTRPPITRARPPQDVTDQIESSPRPLTRAPLQKRVVNGAATDDPGQGTPDGPPLDAAGRETARAPRPSRDSTAPPGVGTSGRKPSIGRPETNGRRPEPTDQAGRVERSESVQRLERVDKVEKAEKPDRVEKVEKVEKLERPDRPEKVEKIERIEKPAKVERVEKVEKIEKPAKPEKVEKIERVEKPAKPERVEKVARAEKPERVEKPTRPGK